MSDSLHENQPAEPVQRRPWLRVAALLVITALGLFVRLYGLKGESVWFDEFTSLVFLEVPDEWTESPYYERWGQYTFHNAAKSLPAFLKINRSIDPATMPVYDAIEYLWNTYISRSIPGMRVLSVIIGILIIPLIYLLGRDLHSPAAGLVAALCVALSPIHRHFAQEIHMYGLMSLLALLSIYTFMRLVRDGRKRWWAAHIITNVLLVWTHSFGALVPMFEGGFLVVFHLRHIKRNAVWIGLHVLIAIPLALFFTTIKFWSSEDTASWMKVPTQQEFIGDLLADDCIGLTYQMRATPQTWELFTSPETAQAAVGAYQRIGRWVLALFVLCGIWVVLRSVWGMVRERRSSGEGRPWAWSLLMLMWWLGPPLFLYTVSVLWRPVIFPRYTTHCSLALYLVLGVGIAAIPWRALRWPAVAALLAFFAYEESLILHGPQRTDWQSAAAHVRQEAGPGDLVLVEDWMWKRVFVYNLGPVQNVVSYAKTGDVLAEAADFFMRLEKPPKQWVENAAEGDAPPCVWVVIRTNYFASGPDVVFEDEARKRGLRFELTEFGGIQHVLVYRVWRDPGQVLPPLQKRELEGDAPKEFGDLAMEYWRVQDWDTSIAAALKATEVDPQYPRAYSYLGMSYKERGDVDAAIEAFRKATEIAPTDYLWSHINLGIMLTEKGAYDEAVAAIEKGLELDPNYSWAFTNKGRALMAKGDLDGAIQAFERAVELDPNDNRGHDGLRLARERKEGGWTPPPPEVKAPAERPEPQPAPEKTTEAADAVPGSAPAEPVKPEAPEEKPVESVPVEPLPEFGPLLEQGVAHLDAREYGKALEVLGQAREAAPNVAQVYAHIAVALLAKGDDNGALASYRKYFALDPEAAQTWQALVEALLDAKDLAQARKEVERLEAEGVHVPREITERLDLNAPPNEDGAPVAEEGAS